MNFDICPTGHTAAKRTYLLRAISYIDLIIMIRIPNELVGGHLETNCKLRVES